LELLARGDRELKGLEMEWIEASWLREGRREGSGLDECGKEMKSTI